MFDLHLSLDPLIVLLVVGVALGSIVAAVYLAVMVNRRAEPRR